MLLRLGFPSVAHRSATTGRHMPDEHEHSRVEADRAWALIEQAAVQPRAPNDPRRLRGAATQAPRIRLGPGARRAGPVVPVDLRLAGGVVIAAAQPRPQRAAVRVLHREHPAHQDP
jgi:hypothetical protein